MTYLKLFTDTVTTILEVFYAYRKTGTRDWF